MTDTNGSSGSPGPSSDPFSAFWANMMAAMPAGGAAPAVAPNQDETSQRMQQAFFDSWSQSCDEIMRSEAFLAGMKQSMDASLAFRQQVNQFLSKAMEESPMASRSDLESIMLAVRGMEKSVLGRVDTLAQRMEAIETRLMKMEPTPPTSKKQSKGKPS